MLWQATLVLVLVTVVYSVVGGVIFHFLEKDYEIQLRSEVLAEFDVLYSGGCLNETDFARLQRIFSQMYFGGLEIDPDTESLANYTRWDVASSIFVAIQIFSSVGFGRVAPPSYKGQVACLVFGFLGIPLFFAAALTAGKLIDLLGRKVCSLGWVRQCCRPKTARVLFFIVASVVGMVLLVFIPSAIFSSMEKWSYGEALYFCLTTLFTIGFSDYLPGYNHNVDLSDEFLKWYRLAVGFWILLLIFWYGLFLHLIKEKTAYFADKAQEIATKKLHNKLDMLSQNRKRRSGLKAEDLKALDDVFRKGQYTTVMTTGPRCTKLQHS